MMKLSLQEFGEYFFALRNGTYKCVFCGKEVFIGNTTDGPTMALLSVPVIDPHSTPPGAISGSHDFYSITCVTCGRSDFFHRNQVEKWVLEHREKKAAESAPKPSGEGDAT